MNCRRMYCGASVSRHSLLRDRHPGPWLPCKAISYSETVWKALLRNWMKITMIKRIMMTLKKIICSCSLLLTHPEISCSRIAFWWCENEGYYKLKTYSVGRHGISVNRRQWLSFGHRVIHKPACALEHSVFGGNTMCGVIGSKFSFEYMWHLCYNRVFEHNVLHHPDTEKGQETLIKLELKNRPKRYGKL